MLGVEVPRRGQAAKHLWLPLVLGWGPLARRTRHAEASDACLWFVDLSEILRKSEAVAKTGHSCGKATGDSLGGTAS